MKKTFFVSLLMFSFCLVSYCSYAQDKIDAKEDPIKDQFVKAYAWTKIHFDNKSEPLVSLKQMKSAEGHEFILVESKTSKVLYDTTGKQYCADHVGLNCIEFYKLSESDLTWSKS